MVVSIALGRLVAIHVYIHIPIRNHPQKVSFDSLTRWVAAFLVHFVSAALVFLYLYIPVVVNIKIIKKYSIMKAVTTTTSAARAVLGSARRATAKVSLRFFLFFFCALCVCSRTPRH